LTYFDLLTSYFIYLSLGFSEDPPHFIIVAILTLVSKRPSLYVVKVLCSGNLNASLITENKLEELSQQSAVPNLLFRNAYGWSEEKHENMI
jgi:hypothetical protein